MVLSKIESDKQILLQKLPELVWEKVFRCNIIPTFSSLKSCYEASYFFSELIHTSGQVWITSNKVVPRCFRQQNISWTLTLGVNLASIIELKPRITTFKVWMGNKFLLDNKLLNTVLESQKSTLVTLHICRVNLSNEQTNTMHLDLPVMRGLRDLKLQRYWYSQRTLCVREFSCLPALETLTLSTHGDEDWSDLLLPISRSSSDPAQTRICETVKHLRLHPRESPGSIQHTIHNMSQVCRFPGLVSLEISAVYLNRICSILPAPEKLRRLTLTLPLTLGHKYVFDMCITGYSKQMCAGILQNPGREPQQIWEGIETGIVERVPDDEYTRYYNLHQPPHGPNRYPGVTIFNGLVELRMKSHTPIWGPTLVSCPDLLSMNSLKLLHFCGYKPEYIPDDMIKKMGERFRVWFKENTVAQNISNPSRRDFIPPFPDDV